MTAGEVATATGLGRATVSTTLSKLAKTGELQRVWQMLADAARLGVIRHGRPEAWAAGAVIALARVNGLLGAGRALTAMQVAEEVDVSLGALAATEHELARALNLERYAHHPGAT